MMENSIQKSLERSRRHRSWVNASQSTTSTGGNTSILGGGDNESVNSIGSLPCTGTGSVNLQSDERTRRQKLQDTVVRSRFSSQHAIKPQTPEFQAEDEDPQTPSSLPAICSASSQDSNQTTGTVASRRQRIMALSAKNKAHRRSYNTSNTCTSSKVYGAGSDVDGGGADNKNNEKVTERAKPRPWQSSPSKNTSPLIPPEPIETQYNISGRVTSVAYRSPKASSSPLVSSPCESSLYHQSNEMEDYNGKEEAGCIEGPPSISKVRVSNKIRSFQRDLGLSFTSNNRESPPPPPVLPETRNSSSQAMDVEPIKKFKRWNERDHRDQGYDTGGRVFVFPSSTARKDSTNSPSSGQQFRRNRFVVPSSPTASIGSVDSSYSAVQTKQHNNTSSRNATSKLNWNSIARSNVSSRVNGSPEPRGSFSSPKYGSQHPRYPSSNKSSIESQGTMYKNLLKPIYRETEVKKSHEKDTYCENIEIPEKSSVSSLHAMFDSQDAVPLMPMNSSHSSVRQNLLLQSPVTPSSVKYSGVASRFQLFSERSKVRHSLEENASSLEAVGVSNDDRSVSSIRSSSSANRSWQSIVPSWSKIRQPDKNKNDQQPNSGLSNPIAHDAKIESFSQSKAMPKEDKSRLRQFYSSSWRMESPVQIHDKIRSEVSTETSENKDYGLSRKAELHELNSRKGGEELRPTSLTSSWQQSCKPRPLEIDTSNSLILYSDGKSKEIKVNALKNVEPSALPPSVVSSFMYSQNKNAEKPDSKGTGIEAKPRRSSEPSAIPLSIAPSMYSQKADSDQALVKGTEIEDVKGTKIDINARTSFEPNARPASAVSSLVYAQMKHCSEENQNNSKGSTDWPCGTNDEKEMEEDAVTDIILDSLTDIIPNDVGMTPIMSPALDEDKNTLASEKYLSHDTYQDNDEVLKVQFQAQNSASEESQLLNQAQSPADAKPWENDTKRSTVQSWQMRSSKLQISNPKVPLNTGESELSLKNDLEVTAPSNFKVVVQEDQIVPNIVGEATNDTKVQSELLTANSSSDSFIEEKKSGDLSFDEDEILGQDVDGRPSPRKVISIESSQHVDQSKHPRKMPFYDDDSYLSRVDTDTRELGASESIRTASARSRTGASYNSEDMSIYVEDERIISKKEDKILSAQFEQMNLEVAVGESEIKEEEKKEETTVPDITVNVGNITVNVGNSTVRANLPRLNPSPKDCDEYRSRFFEDCGGTTASSTRGIRRRKQEDHHENESNKNIIPVSKRKNVNTAHTKTSTENQVFDVWASTSHEERDEAIKFDETEQWLNRDPDIVDSIIADDKSLSSDHETDIEQHVKETRRSEPESRPILIKKPPQSFRTPEKQKQRTKVINNNTNTKKVKLKQKQEVFDPFGIDAEEHGGLTVEITEDLFSSNPDPFMSEESFSPLEWSTPRDSNTNSNSDKNNSNSQHIGYYNSPDSRVEI